MKIIRCAAACMMIQALLLSGCGTAEYHHTALNESQSQPPSASASPATRLPHAERQQPVRAPASAALLATPSPQPSAAAAKLTATPTPASPKPRPAAVKRTAVAKPNGVRAKPQTPTRTVTQNGDRKIAYLTFDDGPSHVTLRVLDILKKYHAKGTFFVIGNTSPPAKTIYKRILTEGHTIGNHTYSHRYKDIYKSVEAFERDVNKLNRLLEGTISYRPDIIRFPGGSNNTVSYRVGGPVIMYHLAEEMLKQGYQYFDWNVNSSDAQDNVHTKKQIVDSVKRQVRNKSKIIVLMHDSAVRGTTADALPEIIEYLRSLGYTFEKLDKSAFTWHFIKP